MANAVEKSLRASALNLDYHTTHRAHIKAVRIRHRLKTGSQGFVPYEPISLLVAMKVEVERQKPRSFANLCCYIQ